MKKLFLILCLFAYLYNYVIVMHKIIGQVQGQPIMDVPCPTITHGHFNILLSYSDIFFLTNYLYWP